MASRSVGGSLTHYAKRAFAIAHEEGLWALFKRAVKSIAKVEQVHLLVLGYRIPPGATPSAAAIEANPEARLARILKMTADLEFKRLTEADTADIDGLTTIDEWHTPKEATLEFLRAGSHCYVVKKNGEVIASQFATQGPSFVDSYFKRTFVFADDETYFWRAQCKPAYRSRGVLPRLFLHMLDDLSGIYGKTKLLTLVRTTNGPSIRTMEKMGWTHLGRTGFIDAFGLRFHYMWGREAFPRTKQRFMLRLNK